MMTVLGLSFSQPTGATASSNGPGAALAGTCLISMYPNVKTPPILVEIVRATGKVVRVVERTRFGGMGSGHATWSPNGRMLAWFDEHLRMMRYWAAKRLRELHASDAAPALTAALGTVDRRHRMRLRRTIRSLQS
jgi:hypothetical protein